MKTKKKTQLILPNLSQMESRQHHMKNIQTMLSVFMDVNHMTKRSDKYLSSARYRIAEYWFIRGYIAAMPDGDSKEFIVGFTSMLATAGRSILTLKP